MIICEIGQNFIGDIKLAKHLIQSAKDNGGDLVKFQLYDHNILYANHPEIPDVELSFQQAKDLFKFGEEVGIEVFFSAYDVERVKWCEEIGVKRYKIGFSQRTNVKILKAIPVGKNVIISTDVPYYNNYHKTQWLYCIPKYPSLISDLRFSQISFDDFDGFSDHIIGLDASKIALSRGAEIIEKHFTISHDVGVDGRWSMTPGELRALKQWEAVCKEVLYG